MEGPALTRMPWRERTSAIPERPCMANIFQAGLLLTRGRYEPGCQDTV
jgi:hypothetical protein